MKSNMQINMLQRDQFQTVLEKDKREKRISTALVLCKITGCPPCKDLNEFLEENINHFSSEFRNYDRISAIFRSLQYYLVYINKISFCNSNDDSTAEMINEKKVDTYLSDLNWTNIKNFINKQQKLISEDISGLQKNLQILCIQLRERPRMLNNILNTFHDTIKKEYQIPSSRINIKYSNYGTYNTDNLLQALSIIESYSVEELESFFKRICLNKKIPCVESYDIIVFRILHYIYYYTVLEQIIQKIDQNVNFNILSLNVTRTEDRELVLQDHTVSRDYLDRFPFLYFFVDGGNGNHVFFEGDAKNKDKFDRFQSLVNTFRNPKQKSKYYYREGDFYNEHGYFLFQDFLMIGSSISAIAILQSL